MADVLVTGGAGFIGSHTLVALAAAGWRPTVLDDFSLSSPLAVASAARLAGIDIPVVRGDARDAAVLDDVFAQAKANGRPFDAVLHCAGLKSVGESVADPLRYYEHNVGGTVTLLQAMQRAGVGRLVFSSSATVYGEPQALPYREDHPVRPVNPYGHSKAQVERILLDLGHADPSLGLVILRYFNPIGAHVSGELGESPANRPNNLFPLLLAAADGGPPVQVLGDDYDTPDGTGVRDYLHVMDLAQAHVAALAHACRQPGVGVFNLGTGQGTSVLELAQTFERVTGRAVPLVRSARRPGDLASAWADPSHAQAVLGWRAERTIEDMCADGWRWRCRHPQGFGSAQ